MGDIFDRIQFSNKDYVDIMLSNPQATWFQRAVRNPLRTEDEESVLTMTGTIDINGREQDVVLPRVRLNKETGLLYRLTRDEAWDEAYKNKDFIFAESAAEAEFISKGFSDWQGRRGD